MEKRLIDVKELAIYIGLSPETIYSWVSQEKIPFVKVGRLTKFDLRAIDRWISNNSMGINEKNYLDRY